ncbi:hypothetical protein EV122DRAFT_291773 [Schizophyllum commune]
MAETAQLAPELSPIDQLLKTLGMTRDDLDKRSRQMRQFLDNDGARGADVVPSVTAPAPEAQPCTRLSRSQSAYARPISRASSMAGRDASPPATPVKAEPRDATVPLSMEAVIERQNQSRREKKRKEKASGRAPMGHPPSPTPSASRAASVASSRGVSVQPLASRSTDNANQMSASLLTPSMSKYYREHTLVEPMKASARTMTAPASTSSATSTASTAPAKSSQPPSSSASYNPYLAYPRYLPLPYPAAGGSGAQPVTPQANRTLPRDTTFSSNSFPPSSPPQASPQSSPAHGIVNLVSSPGGPANGSPSQETDNEAMPFKLPPGPYSPFKPERSYAAIIGQAILSSPEHRLTLQEIYDWITIVYPYFKRGETTWMNSIRHVLSTTVVFRKVPRDRSVGRSLWAIWDQDLECFEGGGFKKHKCKDANVKEPSRSNRRKRAADDEDAAVVERASKKARPALDSPPSPAPAPTLHAQPLFPPTRPATHHQPYYTATEQPPGIIFPPLPATSNFQRVAMSAVAAASSSSSSFPASQNGSEHGEQDGDLDDGSPVEPPAMRRRPPRSTGSISSLPSVPALTPNHSSSSPPSSMPPSSDADFSAAEDDDDYSSNKHRSSNDTVTGTELDIELPPDSDMTSDGLMHPAPLYSRSRSSSSALQPGIMLDAARPPSAGSSSSSSSSRLPGKRLSLNDLIDIPDVSFSSIPSTACTDLKQDPRPLPPIRSPSSPGYRHSESTRVHVLRRSVSPGPPSTPPPRQARKRSLQYSPSGGRSPLSQMSPVTSLEHYKSHLDHPMAGQSSSHMRSPPNGTARQTTPPRRMVTPPRKSVTLANLWPHTSPYRTPTRGYPGMSPFRTPNGRLVLDDYDTSALLDEEVRRSALRGMGDSPGGFFGKGRSHLLYDSPGALDTSPGTAGPRYY